MNKWDDRYKNENYLFGKEPNVFLKEMQQKLDVSGNVLSIAEGEGRNAVFLAEQGLNVTAWDYSKVGIEKMKKLAKERNVSVHTKQIDLNDVNWNSEEWDEIVFIYGHFPKPLRQKTLNGVQKAVKQGGYFISEVYSHYQIPYKSGGPKEVELLYKPEDFLDTFSHWRIIHFFIGEVVRHEGERHNGLIKKY